VLIMEVGGQFAAPLRFQLVDLRLVLGSARWPRQGLRPDQIMFVIWYTTTGVGGAPSGMIGTT
jgi:hypothetical protein